MFFRERNISKKISLVLLQYREKIMIIILLNRNNIKQYLIIKSLFFHKNLKKQVK